MKGSVYELKSSDVGRVPYGGLISVDGETRLYFFHKTELQNCNIRQIEEGDVVEFVPAEGKTHDKPRATNVRKLFKVQASANMANPGINPNVGLHHFNDDEKKIIKTLSKTFYVTSGGSEFVIGESSYRYFLIKPTEYFVRTFQLSRELVVIFSDYVSFEPRSLDAASYVYRTINSQLRLDRGCHLLICHDDCVEEKLVSLLKDNNVRQIVIPFTYREFLDATVNESIIQERFRKYLFDTDLFGTSKPIQNDIFFFGRRDLVHDIVSKCKNNTHCGVFGLRRSGKTSVLYAVQALLEQQSYHTVFIPCEGDLSSLDWRIALYRVVCNVYQTLGMDQSVICKDDYNSFDTVIYFENDMNYCLQNESLPVTLMFDEIEAITFNVVQGEDSENLWIDGDNFVHFWNTIKGYYSKYPKRLSILVAGTNPMINEVPTIGKKHHANPMFKVFSESNQGAYLQAFSVEDTKNMVNTLGGYMGVTFDPYCVSKLTSDCGGHPYLMRLLCSYINRYIRINDIKRPVIISQAIYDKAVPEFEKSSEAIGFFWMVLNILMTNYPKEFETLKVLALEGDSIISRVQEREALPHLIGYGLIDCNQNNYAIKYNTIASYLQGKYMFERTGLSIEEQKEEIRLRINKAEIQLRLRVKIQLQSMRGQKQAKEIVLDAMRNNDSTYNDASKAERLEYSQLFDPSVNKVYFSLLKDIIVKNMDLFEFVFEGYDTYTISSHLERINKARRCPDHSYTESSEKWSWDDFMAFRESISWLEQVLKDYEN